MDLLDAEREQILIEKAKLETMERLKPTSMPTVKRQTELDAAIQIAQVLKLANLSNMNCFKLKIISMHVL